MILPDDSTLNLASLKAIHNVKNVKQKKAKISFPQLNDVKYMITGATPKLKKSAKESNCIPKLDSTFNNLARRPSKPSMI